MHIHSEAALSGIDQEGILKRMETAGVYGGCIFSERPHEGVTFEERLEGVMTWTKGYEERLFPVMYIHPDEEDILQKIHIAGVKVKIITSLEVNTVRIETARYKHKKSFI